jgi:hypothetical protein
MEIAAAVIATVLLTVVAMAISRAGGKQHQEDLDDHGARPGAGRDSSPGRPEARRTDDRPAGPGAEAMGVSGAGATSVDPASERAGRDTDAERR